MSANDTFIFICPACGYKARLPEQFAGRTIKCPGCQAPQTAVAPVNVQRKTATFTKVGATPMPFSLPKEQADALAAIPAATPIAPAPSVPMAPAPDLGAKAFPSPLPGAIQITTDRIGRSTPSGGSPTIGTSSNTARLAKPAGSLVDFTCTACHARLRLPSHYTGKSILCPKCSSPQLVTPTNMEPMDTTRSLSQKSAEAALSTLSPMLEQQAPPAPLGSGTGMRVRVTPLPQTYPTPMPTAAPPPTPAVAPLAIAALAPVKNPEAPIATPLSAVEEAPLADLIDNEVASSPSQSFAKPHPSKSKSASHKSVSSPVASPAASSAPAQAPAKPIALIAVLLVSLIALAATWAYHLVANGDSRAQLEQAQAAAKAASDREAEVSAKLAELTTKLAELEQKLTAAAATPAPTPVDATNTTTPVAETPAPAPAPTEPTEPAVVTPADPVAPAPTTPAAETPPAP